MAPPNSFLGKSIRALELRRQYYIEVLGVKESITDEVKTMFGAGFIIKEGGFRSCSAREKISERARSDQGRSWMIVASTMTGPDSERISGLISISRMDGNALPSRPSITR